MTVELVKALLEHVTTWMLEDDPLDVAYCNSCEARIHHGENLKHDDDCELMLLLARARQFVEAQGGAIESPNFDWKDVPSPVDPRIKAAVADLMVGMLEPRPCVVHVYPVEDDIHSTLVYDRQGRTVSFTQHKVWKNECIRCKERKAE